MNGIFDDLYGLAEECLVAIIRDPANRTSGIPSPDSRDTSHGFRRDCRLAQRYAAVVRRDISIK